MNLEQGSNGSIQNFTKAQMISIMVLAAYSGIVIALLPLLLGAMLRDGRLTITELGHAATALLLSMAVTATFAGAKLKPSRVRLITAGAVLVAGAANGLTMISSGNEIVGAQLLNGICAGIFLWLLSSMLARGAGPARLHAISFVTTYLIAIGLSRLCSQWLIPNFGGRGAFASLLGANIIMLILALLVPKQFTAIAKVHSSTILPKGRGLISLAVAITFEAAATSVWAYFVPLSSSLGQAKSVTDDAISVVVAFQLIGALTAAVIGRRISYAVVMSIGTLLAILSVIMWGSGIGGTLPYIIAGGIFGFVWRWVVPYQVAFTIAADPSRRTAMFIVAAQSAGLALGPFLSSLVVSGHRVTNALVVSGTLFGISLLALGLLQRKLAVNSSTFGNSQTSADGY